MGKWTEKVGVRREEEFEGYSDLSAAPQVVGRQIGSEPDRQLTPDPDPKTEKPKNAKANFCSRSEG